MRKLLLALALALAGQAQAHAWPGVVDAQNGALPQLTIPVFNDSGATIQSGEIVSWDTADTDLSVDFSPYVIRTSTVDDPNSAGVMLKTCTDQTQCEMVVYGPALVRCLDVSDAVTIDTTVGVNGRSVNGACGDYTPAANKKSIGVALTSGGGSDYDYIPVFVNTLGGADP